ncbi:MAG TPA: tetratricopeptide repeat protein [Terriglobia bacterium]|nr:tetratricopeptide repeat protein [Terriglobia bacterium]
MNEMICTDDIPSDMAAMEDGMTRDHKMPWKELLHGLLILSMLLASCFLNASPGGADQQPGPLLQKIWMLVQQGNLAEARAQLDECIKTYPTVAGFRTLLGIIEAQQKHFSAAELDFRKSIELDPKFLSGYLNLGHLYQEQLSTDPEVWEKSVATYESLLKIEPSNAEANFQLALLLEGHGRFQDSLRHIDRLPGAIRKQKRALALSVADYAGIGNDKQAEATSTELMTASDLTEADIAPVLAVLEARHQEVLEAQLLSGLAARGLASSAALQRLGKLYARQGRLPEARRTLEEVAVREARPTYVLLELGRIADQQKDYISALGFLARARDLEPGNSSVHYLFGMVCVQENLSQEAYTSLKRAVSLKPDDPYYNYALGAVILDRQDTREAIPYFEKFCKLRPNDPRGRFGLGAAYFLSHDLVSASREFKSIEEFPQTRAGARYFLGRIANLQGDFDTASKELELALKEQPEYPEAYTQLGLVRMNQKQYLQAENAFHAALARDPDNYLANLNLMILYQRRHDPRAQEQEQKFATIKNKRDITAKMFLRTVEVVR